MMAFHSSRPVEVSRPSNPMSISSLLNNHDRPKSDGLNLLYTATQRPLPPMVVPVHHSDLSYQKHYSLSLAYRPHQHQHQHQHQHHQAISSSAETSPVLSDDGTASRRGSVARAPRPKYSDDQGYFIWYHRTDLAEPWDKVLQEFEKQFNHRRPKGGLQCKFYRLLGDWGVEKVREQARQSQSRSRELVGRYGLVQRTHLRFDWMRPEHEHAPMLPQFQYTNRHDQSPGGSPCPGCDECVAKRTARL